MEEDKRYILRWAKKIMATNLLGGKCKKCGNDDVFVLEFHHIDPNEKDEEIQDIRGKQWSSIKKEIEKCELLCRNCHSETHHPNSIKKTKEKLLNIKGANGCSICGYNKNHSCLDFHHRESRNKKFNFAHIKIYDTFCDSENQKIKSKDIYSELKKCDVVCKNCHKKNTYIDIDRFERLRDEIYQKVFTYIEVKKPEQDRMKQLKVKNSEFRNKLAIWIKIWRSCGSAREAALKIGIHEATLVSALRYTRGYRNRKNRVLLKRKNTSSKYFGVSKTGEKWHAYIKINGKTKHLGNYKSEIEAARAVDKEYVKNYKNLKRINLSYSSEDISKMLN